MAISSRVRNQMEDSHGITRRVIRIPPQNARRTNSKSDDSTACSTSLSPSPSSTTSSLSSCSSSSSSSSSASKPGSGRLGTWTPEEHDRFIEALELFPRGPWKVIAQFIGTKTPRQAMSHAQKYRQKIERHQRKNADRDRDPVVPLEVDAPPPPAPMQHHSHHYQQPMHHSHAQQQHHPPTTPHFRLDPAEVGLSHMPSYSPHQHHFQQYQHQHHQHQHFGSVYSDASLPQISSQLFPHDNVPPMVFTTTSSNNSNSSSITSSSNRNVCNGLLHLHPLNDHRSVQLASSLTSPRLPSTLNYSQAHTGKMELPAIRPHLMYF